MTTDRTRFAPPYGANHERVRYRRGKASAQLCEGGCQGKAKDWALIHGKDPSDIMSYVPLCRRCHWQYDGDTQRLGPIKRSANPSWIASRQRLRRDEYGRYAA